MLSVVVTEISTTWAEVVNKVKWIIVSCQLNEFLSVRQQLFTWLSWWLPLRLSKRQHHNNSLSQNYTHPDRQLDHTIPCYPWVQTIYCITAFVTTDRMTEKEYIIKSKSKVYCCYCCLYLKYNYTYKLKYLLHQQVKRPEYQLVVYIH